MSPRKALNPKVAVLSLVITALVLVSLIPSFATEDHEDMVRRIADVEHAVWNRGQLDRLDEIYDPHCILHVGSSVQFEGTQAFKAMVGSFHAEFPDRRFSIDEIFGTKDRVVQRYRWTGTHSASGTQVSITGCVVYHVQDGRVVEAWNFEDMLSLYQQLGLVSSQSPFSGGPSQ